MTACAAKCTACWDEPHCLSIVTAGTLSGRLEASTMLRPKAKVCSPTWLTQPMITSSIAAGSTPASATSARSEEHTSELQSLMRISYAVFCLKKKTTKQTHIHHTSYT